MPDTATMHRDSYWELMVSHYKKRNASLERRQAALSERVKMMECTLPSLLMGTVVSMKRPEPPSRMNTGSTRSQYTNDYSACSTSTQGKAQARPEIIRTEPGQLVNGRPDYTNRFTKSRAFKP